MFVLMYCNTQNPGHSPIRISLEAAIGEKFHYWFGSSGESYLHTVFSPQTCPALTGASYIAVYRDPYGTRHVLGLGVLDDDQQDTASVRRSLSVNFSGANEIHLHLLAKTPRAAALVVDDLQRRHLHVTALAS